MYEHLSVRTREVILGLTSGEAIELGGRRIGPLSEMEARVLRVLAESFQALRGLSGTALAENVIELLGRRPGEGQPGPLEGARQAQGRDRAEQEGWRQTNWRIGRLRACSFRGLAPAGAEWAHDFGGRSHLLYGPNGCGKSSLLGAISWCLTGRIFRDDQPPSHPQGVVVFPGGDRRCLQAQRPDALALMDGSGGSTSPADEYWVELQLVGQDRGGDCKDLWIRRHSVEGLSMSRRPGEWEPIGTLGQAGVADLDAELRLLLPARASHIRFGKGSDLIQILSQVVGLDDLEHITGLADSLCRTLRKQATDIESNELAPEEESVPGILAAVERAAAEDMKDIPYYNALFAERPEIRDVEAFLKAAADATEEKKQRLAADLGIAIPEQAAPGYSQARDSLDNLPGQLRGAIDQLEKSISELFPGSLGFRVPSEEQLQQLEHRLAQFENEAREKARERLEWAAKQTEDPKASLMLLAAKHFPEGSTECPVCTQDLSLVPQVRDRLERLHALSAKPHLAKELRDMERALIDELSRIVPQKARDEAAKPLRDRIVSDWRALKQSRFTGFLSPIAARFDAEIQAMADRTSVAAEPAVPGLAEGHGQQFQGTFSEADEALGTARGYLRLCRSVLAHSESIRGLLGAKLLTPSGAAAQDSLRAVLERGRLTNRCISELDNVRAAAGELLSNLKRQQELCVQVQVARKVAGGAQATRELNQAVRGEVVAVVKGLEGQMNENFCRLYDDDVLRFGMLTMGHAANPNVRDEMNAYMVAGDERVPVGPFCNQGRMRAIILSLIFALLQKSGRSLDVLVLDDPSLSLDNEHKARFVDHLVKPFVSEGQVILATHYWDFYKAAALVFQDGELLKMPPRRRSSDPVSFEPEELLERVERALDSPGCCWREMSLDLRRWVERTLATLSGYSPAPFVVFNDTAATLAAYVRITDPRVATPGRDLIVTTLQSAEVQLVLNKTAHDDDPTQTEVRDCLKVLRKCSKVVRREVDRLKELYGHDLLRRAVEARPSLSVLTARDSLSDCDLKVVGAAAAAHNGVGVCWGETCTARLTGAQAALATLDTISPVARIGDRLLLDPLEKMPANGDLVVAVTEDGKRYLRKFWQDDDHNVCLQAVNATTAYAPVALGKGRHRLRRVVGVLTDPLRNPQIGDVGKEWVEFRLTPAVLDDAIGVRVRGTCLEPVAREGQIVLLRGPSAQGLSPSGELLCVEMGDEGALIKHCHSHGDGSRWILQSLNVNEPESPIIVDAASVTRVYTVVGVLFEAETREQ